MGDAHNTYMSQIRRLGGETCVIKCFFIWRPVLCIFNPCRDDDSLGDLDGTWDTSCPSEAFEKDGGDDVGVTEEEETDAEEEEATPSPVSNKSSRTVEENKEGEASFESTQVDGVNDDDDAAEGGDDDGEESEGRGGDNDIVDDDSSVDDGFSVDDDGTNGVGDSDDDADAASGDDDGRKRRLRGSAS